jgi:predicted CXXCH cytochrome family protein
MTRFKLLVLFGVITLVSGFSLLALGTTSIAAQDGDEAPSIDYVGADECADCHRNIARLHDDSLHVLTLQDDADAILADFDQGEAVREVTFPGDDAPRAFDADDVAYVVGTGRYVQRYLYEVDRNEYRVLPAEWDVQAAEWHSLELADSWDDPAYDWEQSCAYCHTTGLDLERGRWEDDGVQCETCHGPGEDHAELASDVGRSPSEEELTEVRAAINSGIDPQTCGQCHSRGVSDDGRPYPTGYFPGGELSDHFTLVEADQADHWWSTGHASLSSMQYNEWVSSDHALSLVNLLDSEAADDSCLTCHSAESAYVAQLMAEFEAGDRESAPPASPTTETALYGVACISCHNPHLENDLPADLVQETYALCVSCHSNAQIAEGFHHPVQEMWEGLAVIDQVSPEPGVHYLAEDGPTCVTCHAAVVPVESGQRASHSLAPVMPGVAVSEAVLQDSCSGCHEEVTSPELMQALIDDIQTNTQQRIDTARAAVTETTPAWVSLALDFVEGEGSLGIHNYTYSDAMLDAVYDELNLFVVANQ